MADLVVLGQLIDSMQDAVEQLELAIQGSKVEEAKKLKMYILDAQKKIAKEVSS